MKTSVLTVFLVLQLACARPVHDDAAGASRVATVDHSLEEYARRCGPLGLLVRDDPPFPRWCVLQSDVKVAPTDEIEVRGGAWNLSIKGDGRVSYKGISSKTKCVEKTLSFPQECVAWIFEWPVQTHFENWQERIGYENPDGVPEQIAITHGTMQRRFVYNDGNDKSPAFVRATLLLERIACSFDLDEMYYDSCAGLPRRKHSHRNR